MRRAGWAALAVLLLSWSPAGRAQAVAPAAGQGGVATERVDERRGDVALAGELTLAPTAARRPGVLLLDDAADPAAAKRRATAWARSGRVVLRLDPPAPGRDAPPARRTARRARRAQAEAALALLRRDARVDGRDLAVVGYGDGAAAALDLATSGIALDGVACVGGDPEPPAPEAARRIAGRVLLVVRDDDPPTPPARRRALEDALLRGEVDWRVVRTGTGTGTGADAAKGGTTSTPADADATVAAFLDRLWSGAPGRNGTPVANAEATRPMPPPPAAPAPPAPPAARPRPATPAPAPVPPEGRSAIRLPRGVPAKVGEVLEHVDATGEALEGYVGGRNFLNVERRLPQTDRQGRRIRYREWDVNPQRPGVNRGAERLVTGDDGSAYFTRDHYDSFTRIR
jgi:dienelactone hydrolase/guanyl-specific ribonuclease Sa